MGEPPCWARAGTNRSNQTKNSTNRYLISDLATTAPAFLPHSPSACHDLPPHSKSSGPLSPYPLVCPPFTLRDVYPQVLSRLNSVRRGMNEREVQF